MYGLPPSSRTVTALRGDPWHDDTHLLALIAELIHENTLLFLKANTKKGTQIPKRLRVPRPGDKPETVDDRHTAADWFKARNATRPEV